LKVCIPTMGDKGLDEEVGAHFGRVPTYTIIDTETNNVEVVKNNSEHMGGVGLPAEILASLGIDVLVCSGLGRRAIMLLTEKKISVYKGAQGTVRETYDKWKNGQLPAVNSIEDACQQHEFRQHDHKPGESCQKHV